MVRLDSSNLHRDLCGTGLLSVRRAAHEMRGLPCGQSCRWRVTLCAYAGRKISMLKALWSHTSTFAIVSASVRISRKHSCVAAK
eukprot:822790-Prymnesium_polylepis.2